MIVIRLLLPLALLVGGALPAFGQAAEDHPITCEIDMNELTDADRNRLQPEFRDQSFLTPVNPQRGDFAEKKCTFSAPDQTAQIRCTRVVEGWANAPRFTTKVFRNPCTISGLPECGVNIVWEADNQTFKISPIEGNTAALLELFCVRNKR